MSPQRVTSPYTRQRKAADDPTIVSLLWPIVVGFLFTFLALRIGGILLTMGQEQFSVLYPWVALVKSQALGIDYGTGIQLGQILMFIQFPIYGFLAGAVLYMSNSLTRAFFTVFSFHLLALIAFIAISIFRPS